uniref:Muscarinic acetylcholine receptor n=1 Tax=Eptatretus burgeri TaxID=7764 RepID=A0A8C4R9S5_EPTBU
MCIYPTIDVKSGTNKTAPLIVESYSLFEVVAIATFSIVLSLVTILGNVLVMLSIKVNRQLQTVNNAFLFSLACADLIIGAFSMNLYTLYVLAGRWLLGPLLCDLWLALDYVVSNASVMNLLLISFDRYFCVTKPLTYPVRRSLSTAGIMIASAWLLSLALWAPAILLWPSTSGVRSLPNGQCHIQFLSNTAAAFGTAIIAFYLPVITMTFLYIRVSHASRCRVMRPGLGTLPATSPSKKEEQIMERNKESESPFLSAEKCQSSSHEGKIKPLELHPGISVTNRASATSRWARIRIVTRPVIEEIVSVAEAREAGYRQKMTAACRFASVARQAQRRRRAVAARERKVTRTILAILLAFIITWTPYNVAVLVNALCHGCVPGGVWTAGYWLCYINSTINPACYALCNAAFKRTFKRLLRCHYRNFATGR